ncbi:hypothetical protein [Actinokineospora pegani]|uniref:hypothetical protein n=1 Tax=Actinokineospora pegani TaxID=2654637 RepID=UPI0012EAB109|nr:hypothetical protein [Actinokineospora pegani]
MKHAGAVLLALTLATAVPATAAAAEEPDQVVVFQHEFTELSVYPEPEGCVRLPLASHVIFNQTDEPITIYADPLCLVPIEPVARIKPGHGSHVSSVGSFRA